MAAPPLIAPGVCRYSINQSYGNRNVANVIDMRIDTTGTIVQRATACSDLAGILLNEWSDAWLAGAVAQLIGTSVSWVDLDTEEGSTGSRTTTSAHTWPKAGSNSSIQGLPGNVSTLIVKATTGGRKTRSGRIYAAGGQEAWTSLAAPNELTSAIVSGLQGVMTAFLNDVNQTGGGAFVYVAKMVVVHTSEGPVVPPAKTPSRIFESATEVTALQVQQQLATQRRRLRA